MLSDVVLPLEFGSQRGRHLAEDPVHVGAGLAKVAEGHAGDVPSAIELLVAAIHLLHTNIVHIYGGS